METVIISFVVSVIVCCVYSLWWFVNMKKWIENFIIEETEEKKRFMQEFVEETLNKHL